MGDDTDDWADLEDKGAPVPIAGANRETLRKALSVNPSMRGNLSTEKALEMLDKRAEQPKQAGAKQPGHGSRDLSVVFDKVKADFIEKKKQLQAEKQRIEQQERELGPKAFDQLFTALLELDPNLTGLQTAEIFKRDKTFLDQVGMTPASFLDRKKKGRK